MHRGVIDVLGDDSFDACVDQRRNVRSHGSPREVRVRQATGQGRPARDALGLSQVEAAREVRVHDDDSWRPSRQDTEQLRPGAALAHIHLDYPVTYGQADSSDNRSRTVREC